MTTGLAVRMEPGGGPQRWWYGNSPNGRLPAQLLGPKPPNTEGEVYAEERGGRANERGHFRCASQGEAIDALERVFETRVIVPLHHTEKP